MRRELAEQLLKGLLNWDDAEKANERAMLEAFAAYKYDEYDQFSPGRRFLESLILWLRQFKTVDERRAAYAFVRSRLVFISDAEMNHLVELAYPTIVRPHLIEQVAAANSIAPYRIKHIMESAAFRADRRKTLVLGLSDGARTDRFRRANPMEISNEQIWHAYDVSKVKAGNLIKKLKKDLPAILDRAPTADEAKFTSVVLLDDFTASGTSYIRIEDDGEWAGKIPRVIEMLNEPDGLGAVFPETGVKVIIIIYVASPKAIEHISPLIEELEFSKGEIQFCVVQTLNEDTRLSDALDSDILALAANEDYFDKAADDEHADVGGESMRYGYAGCRLPVILNHNTPNNSIYLLWAEDVHNVHGLFPRVSRHRKFE